MLATCTRRHRPVPLALLAGALATACLPPQPIAPTPGRELLRAAEVPASYRTFTVLDMLRDLRPEYLRNRAHSTRYGAPTEPVVYVNGVRLIDVDMLRHWSARSVVEVRYLTGTQAMTRYGLDHEGGVVLVTVRTAP